ncbi:MAG: methyltransferase domain-containing protein, partial [Alphaproteobacteria bacterium]|nr:methyltransferase domain-containing protein [Alphaproteobacteria bacterium]
MPDPAMPDPIGVPVRRAALKLLDAVLRRGQVLETALHGATQGLANPADRALTHAIAAEVLRWLPDLDALVDSACQRPLPDDAKARMALRSALAQALRLGTPPHAAIATMLPLLEGGPKRLVHGVFGTLMRGGAALPELPALTADVSSRWGAHWGGAMVEAARAALIAPRGLDLTLRDAAETDHWCAMLGGSSLIPGHVRVSGDVSVPELPGYAEGAWWVQNIAASMPARLLGQGEGRTVLDLCAAPGGKTMQLAAAGWRVTAVELSAARARRLHENLARAGLDAEITVADVMHWVPPAPVDAILLDAPCTSTGIFARHPDVLYRVRVQDIAAMAAVQAAMLARASAWLKPGGVLVYATCSLEPEEG